MVPGERATFRKVIVGIDGREGGTDAVALAHSLAAPDAEVVLVDAYPFDAHPGETEVGAYEELLREAAMALLAVEGDHGPYVRHAVPDFSPGRALQAQAESEAADLIVIGSCHRGPLGGVLVGDVSRAVLHGAPCPVAVAPGGYRNHTEPVRVIGVGVDRRAPARAAVRLGAAVAGEMGAELHLVSVIGVPAVNTAGYAYYEWSRLRDEHSEAATHLLAELVAGLDVSATSEVMEGIPAEVLEKLSHDVDLLLVGSRGWGAFRRVVLGSTSDRLVHAAACPVIVLPAPPDAPAGAPLRDGVEPVAQSRR